MNQDNIWIDLDIQEHEMVMDMIRSQLDTMELLLGGELCFYNLPPEDPMRKRYMKLNDLLQEVVTLWRRRFGDEDVIQPEHIGSTK